jgi:hypothetical protein
MLQSLNDALRSASTLHGTPMNDFPAPQGLYDPAYEHDACGVAFVVDMHGRRTHDMVRRGLQSLCNLDHRGATNAEDNVGDQPTPTRPPRPSRSSPTARGSRSSAGETSRSTTR